MRTLSHGVLSRLQNLPGAAVFAGVLDAILRPLARSSAGAHVAARLSGLGPSKIRQSSAAKTGSASTTSQSTAGSTLPIIDLASGAPSFSTPADLKDAAVEAINANHNQYAHPNGDAELRRLIAAWAGHTAGRIIDAD